MSEALGGSRLLTFEGGGHTIAFQGVPCIDGTVVSYLVEGVLPPVGTVCKLRQSHPRPPDRRRFRSTLRPVAGFVR